MCRAVLITLFFQARSPSERRRDFLSGIPRMEADRTVNLPDGNLYEDLLAVSLHFLG